MSRTQRAADALLTERHAVSLADFLRQRRDEGVPHWRIAHDLAVATGGVIDVSPTTVWNWCHDLLGEQAA